MILKCDKCGKLFDTDYEVGTQENGETLCEHCAQEGVKNEM